MIHGTVLRANAALGCFIAALACGMGGGEAPAGDASSEARYGTPPVIAAKREHFAFAGNLDYLDGPRLEALGSEKGRIMSNDRHGNWYIAWYYSTSWIRCVRVDGQVETIVGDDRWTADMKIEEGPAAYFPNMGIGPAAGNNCVSGYDMTVYGAPLEGEDLGRIYFFFPRKSPYKIFKNKEKNGRWWFKRVGTPGKAKPPAVIGQSAKIDETDLTNARIGDGWIVWEGNLYSFDEPKSEITCLLTVADYAPRAQAIIGDKIGRTKLGKAEYICRAADGTIYLLYYWSTYASGGHVFRMSADRTQFEYIVAYDKTVKGTGTDGFGLRTKWHCGPGRIQTTGNTLLLGSVDTTTVRRWKDGRVSSLCYDGEWREDSPTAKVKSVKAKGHQAAEHGLNHICIYYPGEEMGGDLRCFTFGPVDFEKPTVGPLYQPETLEEKSAEDAEGKDPVKEGGTGQ